MELWGRYSANADKGSGLIIIIVIDGLHGLVLLIGDPKYIISGHYHYDAITLKILPSSSSASSSSSSSFQAGPKCVQAGPSNLPNCGMHC